MNDVIQQLMLATQNGMAEVYDFFARVIAFDTTNFITHGKEAACQQFIYEFYRGMGYDVSLYSVLDVPDIASHPDYEAGRDAENRPNVTVFLPCAPEYAATAQNVMITSHVDTMPAGDRSLWRTDPFRLTIEDGMAYGLGVSDNKCGAAISYAIARAITTSGVRLPNNLYLTMVSDEEYFGGNGSLLACLRYPCDLYINLDGCDFEPQIAGLGGTCYELSLRYRGETSSAEAVVDGLYEARRALERFGERRRAELEADPLYTCSEHAKSAYRLMEFGCGTLGTNVDLGKLKIVVYSTLSRQALKAELDDVFKLELQPLFEKAGLESAGFCRNVRCMEYARTENPQAALRLRDWMQIYCGHPVAVHGACLSDLDIYLRNGSPNSFNVGLIREFKLEGGAHKPNERIQCCDFENLIRALLCLVSTPEAL